MNKAVQTIAEEISHRLTLEMNGGLVEDGPTPTTLLDLLLQRLATKVARQLTTMNSSVDSFDDDLEVRLAKVEKKLARQLQGQADNDSDMAKPASDFPNLKYAKPKYKNVESILKYVERDEDKGGVKLVIMNFND